MRPEAVMPSEVVPSERTPAAGYSGTGTPTGDGPRSGVWNTARGPLSLDRPRIMGVLNTTPDSFWDGGRHDTIEAALRQAERLLADGADILDVGGESTRPGARPVPAAEEVQRVVPVIERVVRAFPDALISVDTVKPEVAGAALDAGAAIVNDVSALRLHPELAERCAAAGAGLVLMHSRGTVERMASYDTAGYGDDVVADVLAELRPSLDRARAAGVDATAIVLDPGLGFSKRTEDTVAVLKGLDRMVAAGWPVLVGPSRKRFIGELAGGLPPEERLPGTLAACVAAWRSGARIFRVHDAGPARRALAVAEAVTP